MKTLNLNLVAASVALTFAVGCGDDESSGGRSASIMNGGGTVPIEKSMSGLTIEERSEFSALISDRLLPLMLDESMLHGMCSLTGAMAGAGALPEDSSEVCEMSIAGCQEGISEMTRAVGEIQLPDIAWTCDVNVGEVLTCIEGAAQAFEHIASAGREVSCQAPERALQSLNRRLSSIQIDGARCERLTAQCPGLNSVTRIEQSMPNGIDLDIGPSAGTQESNTAELDFDSPYESEEASTPSFESNDDSGSDFEDDFNSDFEDDFDSDFEDDFDF